MAQGVVPVTWGSGTSQLRSYGISPRVDPRQVLALTLLVASVLADHHDAAMATNDLALIADRLDAWVHLHDVLPVLVWLFVAINNAAAGEVIRRKFNHYAVIRKDADVVHSHLAADVRKNFVTVVQLHAKHGIRQRLHDRALKLDRSVFFTHACASSFVLVGAFIVYPGHTSTTKKWWQVVGEANDSLQSLGGELPYV